MLNGHKNEFVLGVEFFISYQLIALTTYHIIISHPNRDEIMSFNWFKWSSWLSCLSFPINRHNWWRMSQFPFLPPFNKLYVSVPIWSAWAFSFVRLLHFAFVLSYKIATEYQWILFAVKFFMMILWNWCLDIIIIIILRKTPTEDDYWIVCVSS